MYIQFLVHDNLHFHQRTSLQKVDSISIYEFGGGVAETGGARAGTLWKIQNKKDTEFSMEFTSLGFTILKSQAGIKVFPTLHFEMDSGWISSQSLDRY